MHAPPSLHPHPSPAPVSPAATLIRVADDGHPNRSGLFYFLTALPPKMRLQIFFLYKKNDRIAMGKWSQNWQLQIQSQSGCKICDCKAVATQLQILGSRCSHKFTTATVY